MILSADERTLIVAESTGQRLTAFDVAPSGALSGERTFASLQEIPAALDSGSASTPTVAVWVGDPMGKRVIRVLEGGEVTDSLTFGDLTPVACVLGGPDRRTLYVCAAPGWGAHEVGAAFGVGGDRRRFGGGPGGAGAP